MHHGFGVENVEGMSNLISGISEHTGSDQAF